MRVSNASELASTPASVLMRICVELRFARTIEIIFDFVSDKRLHTDLFSCTCIAITGWSRAFQGQMCHLPWRRWSW